MVALFFIVLIPVTNLDKMTLLETYPSMEACQLEKERITKEMEKSYPGDTSWTLVCRPKGPTV